MRKLMADHPLELRLIKNREKAGRRCHHRVVFIPPGGKSVRGGIVYDVDFRHRKPGRDREVLYACI